MDAVGETEFRSVVQKLVSVAHHSRPDVCFEVKALSTQYGKATKQDMKLAVKKILKLKSETTTMVFPALGPVEDWVIVDHGDAGVKSMPDKITSVGGHVVMLCNKKTSRVCMLMWKSKRIRRKVISSLAGETMAMINTIGEIVYTMAVLVQIYGGRVKAIPKVVVTDSKNLEEAILLTTLVTDSWLVPDIAVIKQALEDEMVMHI